MLQLRQRRRSVARLARGSWQPLGKVVLSQLDIKRDCLLDLLEVLAPLERGDTERPQDSTTLEHSCVPACSVLGAAHCSPRTSHPKRTGLGPHHSGVHAGCASSRKASK